MAQLPWFFALLPFFPALYLSSGTDIAFIRIVVPIFGLCAIVFGMRKKRFLVPTALPFLAWSAFVAVATISLVWAQEPAFALRKALFFLSLLPIGFLIVNVPEGVQKRILSMFLAGSAVSALVALFFFFAQFAIGAEDVARMLFGRTADVFFGSSVADAVRSFPSWYIDIGNGEALLRATFPFPNPHTAALFWGMALALLMVNSKLQIANNDNARMRRFMLFAMRYTLLAALLATFSRGAYVSLLILLMAYGVWQIAAKRKEAMRYKLYAISCSVLAVVMFALVVPSVSERFLSTWDIGEGSNSARIALWHDARNIFLSSPVLGAGLGNFASTLAPGAAYRDPTNAHSTYLEIAAELGLIGLFFFLFALIGGLGFSLRSQQPAIVLALLFFCVHAFFETDLYYPANHVVFLMLLTFAGMPAEIPRNKTQYENF